LMMKKVKIEDLSHDEQRDMEEILDNNESNEDETADLLKSRIKNLKKNDESDADASGFEGTDLLQKRIEELKDQVARSNAELINYRKRKDEEVSKMLKYASEDVFSDLLNVIDTYEKALESAKGNTEFLKYLEGFNMIYDNMLNIFSKYEVTAINPVNEQFDSMYHHAVITDDNKEFDDNIVTEVLQKGYILKDRVIRPAMVKVNQNTGDIGK